MTNHTQYSGDFTLLCLVIDSRNPITIQVPISPHHVTLAIFKQYTSLTSEHHKFYFKTEDSEFGVVKEEITDDHSSLPYEGNKVVAWVISDLANQPSLFELPDGFKDDTGAYENIPMTNLDYSTRSCNYPCPPRLPDRPIQRNTNSLPRSIPRSIYTTTSTSDNINLDNDSNYRHDSRSLYDQPAQFERALHCGRDTIHDIYNALKNDAGSLDIKDREWLKVTVKDAFIGSMLTKWLSKNVYGFGHKREIKRFANQMLSMGLIRNPMPSGPFSEKCYYILN